MIRIATIGTSMITDNFVEVVNDSDRATFVGTLSRDADRADAFTRERGGERGFSALEELCAADDVDAVYIGSPNALHREQALAAIQAGKHILVEKPFCANEREAAEVLEAARQAGVVALEAMRPLHDPNFHRAAEALGEIGKIRRATLREAAEVLEAARQAGVVALEAMRPLHDPNFHRAAEALGEIGKIRRATLRFGKYSSRYDDILTGERTNIFDCQMASGALMDIGVYSVEPMIALFGEPETIRCAPVLLDESTRGLTNGAIDGAGVILAAYPDKVVTLHYSKITADLAENQVEGELGTWTLDALSTPSRYRVDMRGQAVRNAAKQMGYSSTATATTEVELEPCQNNMCFELSDFLDAVEAVQGGADAAAAPCGPFGTVDRFAEVTLATMRVMDEARRQAGVTFPADEA